MDSTQYYFSFCSSFDMALAGILTEAEIAAGLQSCQGNIYILNLAFQFIKFLCPHYLKAPIQMEIEKAERMN